MKAFSLSDHPHRRYNPLEREWVLVSPHRMKRPWKGKVEAGWGSDRPSYDPSCYLCPGNSRAEGTRNPEYGSTFVFDNDFMALLPDVPEGRLDIGDEGLLVARSETGVCRVICFSPRHDVTLAEMEPGDIRAVVDVWAAQYEELGSRRDIGYVTIFENKGELMGCSNPHPHCQIWASASIPQKPAREMEACTEYLRGKGRCLVCDVLALEREQKERLVCENRSFTALVPFWAVWPFETLIVSRRHLGSLLEMTDEERDDYADILRRMTVRYDNLFETSFPYSMGMHQNPTDGNDHPETHFHTHVYPPLLRSATIRKFIVGYELTSEPQRDMTPESAAGRLAALPETHYRAARGRT